MAPVDASATIDRYQITLGLDQFAARLRAARASMDPDFAGSFVAEGNRILAAGEQAVADGKHAEAVGHDVAFHSFLWEQSGNSMLATTAEPLWHYLRRAMITMLGFAERGPVVWAEHRAILDALARRERN